MQQAEFTRTNIVMQVFLKMISENIFNYVSAFSAVHMNIIATCAVFNV